MNAATWVSGLSSILPTAVVVAEGPIVSDVDSERLPAIERYQIETAVPRRRREFAAGRKQARAALAALGFAPCAIPVGPGREPMWPKGLVGSISHTQMHCAVAVARDQDLVALGIDIDDDEPIDSGVTDLITARGDWPGYQPKLLFSAKESVFKATFPRLRLWLGFADVWIVPGPEPGTFLARTAVQQAASEIARLHGAAAVAERGLVTAAWIPAR